MTTCKQCRWFSPIGKKVLMALTGLGLSLFLILHLTGNFLLYAGQPAFDKYAETMQGLGALLWIARGGLLTIFILHLILGLNLALENKKARPIKYQHEKTIKASFASLHMPLTGILLLVFVCFHISHYTLRITNPEIDTLTSKYEMAVHGFQSPVVSGFYILSMVVLGTHTWHGFSSLWQSLGINHPNINCLLRRLGPVFAVVVCGGFISIPISVLLGCIH